MEEQKYRLTYTVEPHPEGKPKSEVVAEGKGGCDCLVFASILGQPGGPGALDTCFVTVNGFTDDDLTPLQQFQIWALWADVLAESLPTGWQQEVCQRATQATKSAVQKLLERDTKLS